MLIGGSFDSLLGWRIGEKTGKSSNPIASIAKWQSVVGQRGFFKPRYALLALMKNETLISRSPVNSRSVPRMARSVHGNILVLLLAITFCFCLTIFMFIFNYARVMIGSNHEQKTAIEAAALACAKDLSRIIIEDPNFGFIGLSDSAPVGNATTAKDGYDLQVHGINTILATVRLDLIIARELGDPAMLQLAQNDYRNALLAKQNLINILQASLLPNSATFYSDCFGNLVTPYEDAVASYQANQVRIAGFSQYIPGSMKLTLGSILGGAQTNTPVPQPAQFANVTSSMQRLGHYLSYTNVPYGGFDFVFAGIGDAITLVDPAKFVVSDQSLPYSIPTIVEAEADQQFTQLSANTPQIIHSLACAQPASTVDPVPAPGRFSVTFINGAISELSKPADLLNDPQLKTRQATITSPTGGDYPNGGGVLITTTWSASSPTASIAQAIGGSLYDWLRKAGTKVNVQSVKNMLDTPFLVSSPANADHTHNYDFTTDGRIAYSLQQHPPSPEMDISENQIYGTAIYSVNAAIPAIYTVTIKDYVHTLGRSLGGRHAGEPLQLESVDSVNSSQTTDSAEARSLIKSAVRPNSISTSLIGFGNVIANNSSAQNLNTGQAATESTVRPTYLHPGLAAEIRFVRMP